MFFAYALALATRKWPWPTLAATVWGGLEATPSILGSLTSLGREVCCPLLPSPGSKKSWVVCRIWTWPRTQVSPNARRRCTATMDSMWTVAASGGHLYSVEVPGVDSVRTQYTRKCVLLVLERFYSPGCLLAGFHLHHWMWLHLPWRQWIRNSILIRTSRDRFTSCRWVNQSTIVFGPRCSRFIDARNSDFDAFTLAPSGPESFGMVYFYECRLKWLCLCLRMRSQFGYSAFCYVGNGLRNATSSFD